MSVIRVGSTSTYAAGWDAIFGGPGGRGRTAKKARGAKKVRRTAAATANRKVASKPLGVKAAKKARRKQSARTKR